MKKVSRVLAILLAVTMLFALVACDKYPQVSAALEKAGYKQMTSSISAAVINTSLESFYKAKGEETKAKVYTWAKDGKLLTADQGYVIEFTNSKELREYYEQSSNTLKGFVKDINEKGLINGNCLLLTVSADMLEAFRKA